MKHHRGRERQPEWRAGGWHRKPDPFRVQSAISNPPIALSSE
jgi:hypothetical protein